MGGETLGQWAGKFRPLLIKFQTVWKPVVDSAYLAQ
jgi:hypothetical protein